MNTPLISIVIPIFNQANVIKKSLDTLLNQTYRPLEIVVVNDGSTDNFRGVEQELTKECQEHAVHLKIIHQENKGAPVARNVGFKETNGIYVIFWDADTIANKHMLMRMYQTLLDHPEASYVYSQFKFGWKIIKSQEFDSEKLKKNNFIDTTSLMRHKDFIGFDEKLKRFQDWDLWLSMLEHGKKGIFIPEVLYQKKVNRRGGMSAWLPSIAYRLPWKTKKVRKYLDAQKIIFQKHHLPIM